MDSLLTQLPSIFTILQRLIKRERVERTCNISIFIFMYMYVFYVLRYITLVSILKIATSSRLVAEFQLPAEYIIIIFTFL